MPHQISANIGKYGGFGCEGIFGSTEYAADSTFCDSGQTTSAPLVPGPRPSIHTHTHKTWTRAVHQFVNLGPEILEAIVSKSLYWMQWMLLKKSRQLVFPWLARCTGWTQGTLGVPPLQYLSCAGLDAKTRVILYCGWDTWTSRAKWHLNWNIPDYALKECKHVILPMLWLLISHRVF